MRRMTALHDDVAVLFISFCLSDNTYLQFPDPISSLILISNARLKWYRDIEHRRYNCNV